MTAFANTTYGYPFVGICLSVFLFGALTVQTFAYYTWFKNDSGHIRYLVCFLWCLELFVTGTSIHVLYYLIEGDNNPFSAEVPIWTYNVHIVLEPIIAFLVQIFYASRLWMLKPKGLRGIISFYTIVILAAMQLVWGLGCGIVSFRVPHIGSNWARFTWMVGLWLGSAAACDISVTTWLVYFLVNSRTGFQRVDNIIVKLIISCLTTGMLTSIFAAADLIAFAAMPTRLLHLAINYTLTKLYTNSMLASLNYRHFLANEENEPSTSGGITLNDIRFNRSVRSSWTRTETQGAREADLKITKT